MLLSIGEREAAFMLKRQMGSSNPIPGTDMTMARSLLFV